MVHRLFYLVEGAAVQKRSPRARALLASFRKHPFSCIRTIDLQDMEDSPCLRSSIVLIQKMTEPTSLADSLALATQGALFLLFKFEGL